MDLSPTNTENDESELALQERKAMCVVLDDLVGYNYRRQRCRIP